MEKMLETDIPTEEDPWNNDPREKTKPMIQEKRRKSMRHEKALSIILVASLALGSTALTFGEEGAAPASFAKEQEGKFREPAMEFWPETRTWLAEGSHTEETLRELVQSMYDSGLGAVEFATLEAGVEPQRYSWGSPEWVSDSHTVIEAASELGMGASFTSGTHWRTANIPTIDPNEDAASQELAVTTMNVSQGETFDGVLPLPQAAEVITRQKLAAVIAAKVNSVSEQNLTDLDSASIVELTQSAEVTEEGAKLSFTAQDGDYILFAYWQRGTGQVCTPSVETNYSINYFAIDGFNAFKEYWDEYIFTDEMKQLIADNGRVQMFMDSLELSLGGGFVYWTSQLREEFEARKGYDIMPYIMLMMGGGFGGGPTFQLDGDPVLTEKYKNDYKDVITQLYIDYLMEPMAEYMHSNGVELRAQIAYGQTLEASLPIKTLDYVESESLNANDQPEVYRYQAGAQHLYGINKFSSETGATWVNYSWSLKHILENPIYTEYLGGVNRVIYHGFASIWGPEGTSWPGFEGMYAGVSERMDTRQPFYQDLKSFNTHLARIQEALRYGQPQVDVGLLTLDYNMRTAYGQPISHLLEHEGYYWKDTNMQDAGYTYEYFNPQILTQEDIPAADGEVDPEGVSYQALIVWQNSLPADAAEKLIDYADNGVAILVLDGAAAYTPWNDGEDEALAAAMETLLSKETVRTIEKPEDAAAALAELGVLPRAAYAEPNQALLSVLRADDEAAYLFVNNYTQEKETTAQENEGLAEGEPYMRHYDASTAVSIDTEISLDGAYVPYVIDTWNGRTRRVADARIEDGRTILPVSLESGDAALYALEPVSGDAPVSIAATTADEAVTVEDQLAVRSYVSGTVETTLTDGRTVTSELTVAEPIDLTSWDLTVEDWQQGELLTRTEEKEDYTTTEYTYDTKKDTIEVHLDGLKTWNEIEEIGVDVSGVGTYTTTFTLPEGFTAENGAYLDLGSLASSAKVTVNGQAADDVNLDRPRLDVSDLLTDGENTLEIRISTTLTNRLLSMGVIPAGVANLWMPFPMYVTGYHAYGLDTVTLIPYGQAVLE